MQKSPKLDSVPPYESWPRTSASWPQVGNLFRNKSGCWVFRLQKQNDGFHWQVMVNTTVNNSYHRKPKQLSSETIRWMHIFWPMHFGGVGSFVKWKKKLQSIKAWTHKRNVQGGR